MVRTEQKLKSHNNRLITIHNKKQSQKSKSKNQNKREREQEQNRTNKRKGGRLRERKTERTKQERKGDYLQYRPAARRRSVTEADVSSVKREREGKASFSLQTRKRKSEHFCPFVFKFLFSISFFFLQKIKWAEPGLSRPKNQP
jgi:hypothetical protein